jgi:UDP-N-acetylglucosamine 4,6-dehydratase
MTVVFIGVYDTRNLERSEILISGNVCITGGTGFLGRAILTVAQEEGWDAHFTVLSRDDNKQRLLRERFPETKFVVGDVRDLESLERTFYGKDLILHAAAFKFLPQAEANPEEAIAINVVGSQNVARAAVKAGVPQVLGISTDKVCSPTSVYGMTKALMERIFTDYNRIDKTLFSLVRYGNVVGSTGSVIPLFQQQHQEGKKLTVTDPSMTRFWLSYQEAIRTIEWGLAAPRFATVIPRCRSMTLFVLARTLNGDSDIEIIGARPGEKRHEELLSELESHRAESMGDHHFYLWMDTQSGEYKFRKKGEELPDGFFYRSDLAEYLTGAEMLKMIDDAARI